MPTENRISEENAGQALAGLKILDFTSLSPGPFATLMLADMGAEVIKIVSALRPDYTEKSAPFLPETDISSGTAYLGRNKRVLTLNLKDSRSADVVRKLITDGGYDIIIEQNRPGVMDKLHLGFEELRAIQPGLIFCSLTGYGQTGSMSRRPGHDINYMALSGASSYSGRRESGPAIESLFIADIPAGSNNCVIGILMAVIYRMRTGVGQHIDVSMTDGVIAFNAKQAAATLINGVDPEPEKLFYNGGGVYDFYETKDGKHVSVGVMEPKFVKALFDMIGRPDLSEWDARKLMPEQTKREIRDIFKTRTRDEWVELIRKGNETCFEPVLTVSEALNSTLAKERRLVVEVPGPGGNTYPQPAMPIKFSETPPVYRHIGKPATDSDTFEIMRELGYSGDEIAQLREAGLLK